MRLKRNEIVKIVLALILLAGAVSLFALMPGLTRLLPLLLRRPESYRRRILKQGLTRLRRRGLIISRGKAAGDERYSITARGRKFLAELELNSIEPHEPSRWDRRWRIVIFDISEVRRIKRNLLRRLLKRLGFMRLQHSVWIHPHDCREAIGRIQEIFALHKESIILVADRFPEDTAVIQRFASRNKLM